MSVIAFDADVLIYAADSAHPLGDAILARLEDPETVAIGSVLLLVEVLGKPMREDPDSEEVSALISLLSRISLRDLDERTARLALAFSMSHGLRAADATHLATAVAAGADHFLTNNRKDFPRTIAEIEVVYPSELGGDG